MEVSAATAAALHGLHAGNAAASSGLGLTAQGSAGAFPANLTSLLRSLTPGLISGLASETQTMLLQLLSNSGTAPADSPARHINIAAVLQQLGMLEPKHFSTGQEQKLLQDSTVGADALASSSGAAGQSPLVAMPAQPARASAGQGQLAQPAQSSQPAVLLNSNATVSAHSSFKAPPTGVGPVLDKQIPHAQQQQQCEDKQQLDQEQSKQQQHGLAQPASGALAQLSQGQSQMLLHLLEPTQQQQQLQQQQQQHRTPLGLPVSTPQQQQALMQLASFISTAAAPPPEPTTAAAAATNGAVREQSSVSGSSTLQQLLAMALGGALPGSGGAGQQQHGHSGFSMQSNTEVADMLLQPQAPYMGTAPPRQQQQQQQQQHQQQKAPQQQHCQAPGDTGDVQQRATKKRRARVMTPSGMGMCHDILPGSIKEVPVALRLAKGSSGEYRLRMPTALILSQFGYAKMPVTLPLEVYVDGKRVAAGAPAKKRQRVAPGNGSSAADSRPTVKIVCDCDRYRLSGLASAGLGRYVGYTVTKVASEDGSAITLFLESPLDSCPNTAESDIMAPSAAAAAAGQGSAGRYDVTPHDDTSAAEVYAALAAAAAATARLEGDAAAKAAAAAAGGSGGFASAFETMGSGLSVLSERSLLQDPGPALLQCLSAGLQQPSTVVSEQPSVIQQQQQQLTAAMFEDLQQQLLQYQLLFHQMGMQPPVRVNRSTQVEPADIAAAAAAAAAVAGGGSGEGQETAEGSSRKGRDASSSGDQTAAAAAAAGVGIAVKQENGRQDPSDAADALLMLAQ